jgi:hypothetical protein
MQVNIVMHSFNAIEARAKKAAQMGLDGKNEYEPDTVAHYIYKNAYEAEKLRLTQEIEHENNPAQL